jgi:hypothetical protein
MKMEVHQAENGLYGIIDGPVLIYDATFTREQAEFVLSVDAECATYEEIEHLAYERGIDMTPPSHP